MINQVLLITQLIGVITGETEDTYDFGALQEGYVCNLEEPETLRYDIRKRKEKPKIRMIHCR